MKNLPPERVAKVEDFVDFLRTRDEEERDAAAERVAAIGRERNTYTLALA